MSAEIWRPAAQTGGRYEVSSLGRVRHVGSGRLLVAPANCHGYRIFTFRPVGRREPRSNMRVHRLVCEAFNGPPPSSDAVIRHLDGDKLNNRPENLAWGTQAENIADQARHGTRLRGSHRPGAKLSNSRVREMRERSARGETGRELAVAYGVSENTVSKVLRRATWTHV